MQPERHEGGRLLPHMMRLVDGPVQEWQVQQAMRDLRDDPEISKLLQGGKALDSAAIIMLMNHPKVLNLLDQPGFLKSAQSALK